MSLHSLLGRITADMIIASMAGSVAFMLSNRPLGSYSGIAFSLALWSLTIATLAMLTMAIKNARQKQVQLHRFWAILLFASLLVAPTLSLGWIALGNLAGMTMSDANIASHAFFVPALAIGALFTIQRGERLASNQNAISYRGRSLATLLALGAASLAGATMSVERTFFFKCFFASTIIAMISVFMCRKVSLTKLGETHASEWAYLTMALWVAPWILVAGDWLLPVNWSDKERLDVAIMLAVILPLPTALATIGLLRQRAFVNQTDVRQR